MWVLFEEAEEKGHKLNADFFIFFINVNRFWGGRSLFGGNHGILELCGRKDNGREREREVSCDG